MNCTVDYSLQLLRSQTASQTFGRGHGTHALSSTVHTIGGAALLATPGRTYTRKHNRRPPEVVKLLTAHGMSTL